MWPSINIKEMLAIIIIVYFANFCARCTYYPQLPDKKLRITASSLLKNMSSFHFAMVHLYTYLIR